MNTAPSAAWEALGVAMLTIATYPAFPLSTFRDATAAVDGKSASETKVLVSPSSASILPVSVSYIRNNFFCHLEDELTELGWLLIRINREFAIIYLGTAEIGGQAQFQTTERGQYAPHSQVG